MQPQSKNSHKRTNVAVKGASRVLKSMDLFSEPVPGFNIRGKASLQTSAGGLISMGIFCVILAYSAHKLQQLLKRKNPMISTNVDSDAFTKGELLNLNENEFAMAFGLMDWK